MVTRRAERALTTRDWERRFRVAKFQPHRAVLHYRQGRLQQACTSHLTCFKGLQGVTRMAYSPSLWLMAIGWWNKINQCRKLKLNLTQLTCFALSLHDTRHTHQVKHRILRILRMQVCIEHQPIGQTHSQLGLTCRCRQFLCQKVRGLHCAGGTRINQSWGLFLTRSHFKSQCLSVPIGDGTQKVREG